MSISLTPSFGLGSTNDALRPIRVAIDSALNLSLVRLLFLALSTKHVEVTNYTN